MPFWVYILESLPTGRHYVGQTEDVDERQDQHNRGEVASTRPYKPWRLVHVEEFSSRSQAIRREREIKGRKKRSFIENLIRKKSG